MTLADDMADIIEQLSPEDQKIFRALLADYERDGPAAFRKLAETNPITYVHILAAIDPKAVRDAVEDALIDAGLTNDDVRRMLAEAQNKH
jgi:hypothetical protein